MLSLNKRSNLLRAGIVRAGIVRPINRTNSRTNLLIHRDPRGIGEHLIFSKPSSRFEGSDVSYLAMMICINIGSIIPIYQKYDYPHEMSNMGRINL